MTTLQTPNIVSYHFNYRANCNSEDTIETLLLEYFGDIPKDVYYCLIELAIARSPGLFSSRKVVLATITGDHKNAEWRCRCLGNIKFEGEELLEYYDNYLDTALALTDKESTSVVRNRLYIDMANKHIFSFNKNAIACITTIMVKLKEEFIEIFKENLENYRIGGLVTRELCDAYNTSLLEDTSVSNSTLYALTNKVNELIPSTLKFRSFETVKVSDMSVELRFVPSFFGVRDLAAMLRGLTVAGFTLANTRAEKKVITIDLVLTNH